MKKTMYRPRAPRATLGLSKKTQDILGNGAGVVIGGSMMFIGIRAMQDQNQNGFEKAVAIGVGVAGALLAATIVTGKSIL